MVVSNTLLRNQSTSQNGQSLTYLLVAGRSNGCFYMVQQPWFLVPRTYVSDALYNHLPHQVKRERQYKALYKVYTITSKRRKTLRITHHALSPSHHHLYIIHLINCLQCFYRITMSLQRPFVPTSDVKQWFTILRQASRCALPLLASHRKSSGIFRNIAVQRW